MQHIIFHVKAIDKRLVNEYSTGYFITVSLFASTKYFLSFCYPVVTKSKPAKHLSFTAFSGDPRGKVKVASQLLALLTD